MVKRRLGKSLIFLCILGSGEDDGVVSKEGKGSILGQRLGGEEAGWHEIHITSNWHR